MKILITGAAGFIGSKLAEELARRGDEVTGVDNINDYYDPRLKYARLRHFYGIVPDALWGTATVIPATGTNAGEPVVTPDMPWGVMLRSPLHANLQFMRLDITDGVALEKLIATVKPDKVMNLAAQAGVRYSIENPMAYVQANVVGFTNLLESCRRHGVKHLVYASSSSIYGGNTKVPFSESDRVDTPVSLYAATKKSNELFARVYASLYGLRSTGLRFFTVYGPWGRPDMATLLFADAMTSGKEIKVFNNGDLSRDFTYIDDIVEGTIAVIDREGAEGEDIARVYNIGAGHPERLLDYIAEIEHALGITARKKMMPMQPGDVHSTYADTSALTHDTGYRPSVGLKEGIHQFTLWYREQYPSVKR